MPEHADRLAEIRARVERECVGNVEAFAETADLRWLIAEVERLRAGKPSAVERSALDRMRDAGWLVAVHNDYVQGGKRRTFYGFSRGKQWVRGEGDTDEAACSAALAEMEVDGG